ncbi:MAG: acetylglutamate kinase [Rhodothermales bacterium]|nr:acetylglutamate kinase [Rhodothermales bacterium]
MKPVTVIKIGGGLVGSLTRFWGPVREILESRNVILVHGGGPQATAMARRLGHEPEIVQGRRVTSDLDRDIVRWTMRGEINLQLSCAAQKAGIPAVGLAGADAGLLRVTRRPPWVIQGRSVDFGWVGDVVEVNPRILTTLLEAGYLPVVAPVGIDEGGADYNVNADTVSVAIAKALGAEELLFVTEAGGLRSGPGPFDKRIRQCNREMFEKGTDAGWIQGGMRVKIQLALEAIEGGVNDVWVVGAGDLVERANATHITA